MRRTRSRARRASRVEFCYTSSRRSPAAFVHTLPSYPHTHSPSSPSRRASAEVLTASSPAATASEASSPPSGFRLSSIVPTCVEGPINNRRLLTADRTVESTTPTMSAMASEPLLSGYSSDTVGFFERCMRRMWGICPLAKACGPSTLGGKVQSLVRYKDVGPTSAGFRQARRDARDGHLGGGRSRDWKQPRVRSSPEVGRRIQGIREASGLRPKLHSFDMKQQLKLQAPEGRDDALRSVSLGEDLWHILTVDMSFPTADAGDLRRVLFHPDGSRAAHPRRRRGRGEPRLHTLRREASCPSPRFASPRTRCTAGRRRPRAQSPRSSCSR